MTLRKFQEYCNFEFTQENFERSKKDYKEISRGKTTKCGNVFIIFRLKNQNDNWIPLSAMKYIGKLLGMPYIKVYEVATFYSMYNLTPVGKNFIQVC